MAARRAPAPDAAPATLPKHPFLVALGERVRALRSRRGMTRKALALAADVSERHLANLEYGVGNASILVLLDVARALQCSLAELLGDKPFFLGAAPRSLDMSLYAFLANILEQPHGNPLQSHGRALSNWRLVACISS